MGNKMIEDYKIWLLKELKPNTVASEISRLKRIWECYDIFAEYDYNKCSTIIDELTYSKSDQRNGFEPKTNIVIEGDYVSGLSSLKKSLCRFIAYLNIAGYSAKAGKKGSAFFMGSFDDFKRFIGPKCRNEVNIFCKPERESHKSICEYCQKKAELQSAHVVDRPIIIKNILEAKYRIGNDCYKVDLDEFFDLFKKAHLPIQDNIFFLCKACHDDLDKHNKITIADIKRKRGF